MYYWPNLQEMLAHPNMVYHDRRNFEPSCNEWMQFTGLKDKNKKEIYEGDFVHLSINEEPPRHRGVVEYLAPKFFVVDGEKSGLILTDKYEVIGNIYENPELIKN